MRITKIIIRIIITATDDWNHFTQNALTWFSSVPLSILLTLLLQHGLPWTRYVVFVYYARQINTVLNLFPNCSVVSECSRTFSGREFQIVDCWVMRPNVTRGWRWYTEFLTLTFLLSPVQVLRFVAFVVGQYFLKVVLRMAVLSLVLWCISCLKIMWPYEVDLDLWSFDFETRTRGKPISQLRFDYDTTSIRRYHDAFDYDGSDRNYDMRSIRLRYYYDTTTTKNWHVHFLLASNWKQARAIRRSRIVVVS